MRAPGKATAPLRPRTIALRRLDTPLGAVWIAEEGRRLAGIHLGPSAGPLRRDLARRLPGSRVVPAGRTARSAAASQLAEYFAGRRTRFSVAFSLEGLSPFTRRVLEAAATIPHGAIVTYGELARQAGRPLAARAVGGALHVNPLPIVIPCHRVVASGPSGPRLGGFGGGLARKRALLRLEGAPRLAP
ncbi:MAG TPA: methylated-DNA--[protein]-cysteine S-methyltransferase [Candidatus Polarisedimenticolia bacterium]|nr:methylated-DNA--[protein]-cysteine S-methyltransferase [Candidatus Polarisedimenticolia bacterium]